MPARLGVPHHRAEQVFHGAGHGHHLVGLEFGEVDDFIRFKIRASQGKALEGARPGYLHRFGKFRKLRAGFPYNRQHPGLLRHLDNPANTWGVPNQRHPARLLYQLDGRPQHLGVGGNRSLGRLGRGGRGDLGGDGRREHVRLQQHPLAGRDKRPHAAERRQQADHGVFHPFSFVGIRSLDSYQVHQPLP